MANILFVFEGQKTEKKISDNLGQYFVNENTVIQSAYCNNIYQLYRKLSVDEDLDTFQLVKEIPENKEALAHFNRNDFAEIYMFFDYDGHDTLADDDKVREIIEFFDEETEAGKMFISYPMVEALKHYSESIDFRTLKVKAKENIRYKKLVGTEGQFEFEDFSIYTEEIWKMLIKLHLKKANYIANENYLFPEKYISQEKIFNGQESRYISVDSTVAVLSAFPLFILEYYGNNYVSDLLF